MHSKDETSTNFEKFIEFVISTELRSFAKNFISILIGLWDYSGVGWLRARVLARCQDVDVIQPRGYVPEVSRIVGFSNGAEVFIGTEEGAWRWIDAVADLPVPASGPLLAVDAREDFASQREGATAERIGIHAQTWTKELSDWSRDALWEAMWPVFVALFAGRRIVFFCKAGRHRSFQLCLWLLSA